MPSACSPDRHEHRRQLALQHGQWAAGKVLIFTLTNAELWKAALCCQGSRPGLLGVT